MKIKRIMIISILLLVFILPSCLFVNEFEDYFSSWVPEKDENVAIVLEKNKVIIGEKTIDVAHLLSEYYSSIPDFEYEDSCKIDQILMVKNNKIYGSKSYPLKEENDHKFGIDIYTIDINTNVVEIVYSGEHFLKNEENMYEYISRNEKTYYSYGNIVIYDGFDYTIFNIETNETEKISPQEYEPTDCKYDIKRIDEGYEITYGEEKREITFEYLLERNEYIAKLSTLEKEYNYRDLPPLEYFWNGNYVFGDTIYFVLNVLEPDGESNALLVSYDIATDSVSYLYHYYTADVPSYRILPISVYN